MADKKSKATKEDKQPKDTAAVDGKGKALSLALEVIEKQFGKGSIMKLGGNQGERLIPFIPTGSIALDLALGIGGVQSSQLVTGFCVAGNNGTLLNIHPDGRVEWTGPLSKNAAAFVKAIGWNIDKKAAGEHALAKSYRKAIERCLRQIKNMSKEDFIAVLETEVDTRIGKAVWHELSKNDEATDERI